MMTATTILTIVVTAGCGGAPATLDEMRVAGREALRAGQLQQAERHLLAALKQAEQLSPDKVPTILDDLSQLHIAREAFDKADDACGRALALREAASVRDELAIARTIDRHAWLAMKQNRLDEALTRYQRALATLEKELGPTHDQVADAIDRVGHVYVRRKEYGEALTAFERSLRVREGNVGPRHEAVADALDRMGHVYLAAVQAPEAEAVLARAVTIREAAPQQPRAHAETLRRLALAQQAQHRFAVADDTFRKARAILEAAESNDERQGALRLVLESHADLLIEIGQRDEADRLRDLARAIRDRRARTASN